MTEDAEPRRRRSSSSSTPEAQADFAKSGFRPVVDGVDGEVDGANDPADPFPTPEKLFTVDGDFSGWAERCRQVLRRRRGRQPLGIITELQQETGKLGEEEMTSALRAGQPTPRAGVHWTPPGGRRRATPRNTLTRGRPRARHRDDLVQPAGAHPPHRSWSTAAEGGWDRYFAVLSNAQTWAAVTLTVTQAPMVTAVNVVMGTIIAWVLVRDRFSGKAILNVIIDVPFALPTIVAGLVLLRSTAPTVRWASHGPTPSRQSRWHWPS